MKRSAHHRAERWKFDRVADIIPARAGARLLRAVDDALLKASPKSQSPIIGAPFQQLSNWIGALEAIIGSYPILAVSVR